MCPPLSTTVVSPGDVIRCKVRLSSKVAISDYDKLDITFLGVSTVAGEPPEIHTFVQVMKSVLPRGADVKTEGMANREWSFQFEVPHQMNCACRGSSLAIPPTYRHDEVLIKYSIELMGKRKQRFSANDKLSVPLVVQRLGPDPVISTAELGVDVGTDDIWKFVRASKKNKGSSYLILVEGQRAPITDAEVHPFL
ncbi:hypothetical protein BT69DRAFT_87129 [Atractiella rhizophila]|nr:hypothetical protein BT69DRAFT_87129 [Atractiella rhizophila]